MIADCLHKQNNNLGSSDPIDFSDLVDGLLIFIESCFGEYVGKNSKMGYNEEYLTQRLVILFLQNGLHHPFIFIQENKELGSQSKVDIGVYPREKELDNEAFFVIEAKRLPAPPPKNREREYVVGRKRNGAIERFKRKKHGAISKGWAIIAYVEKENCGHWIGNINKWIKDLSNTNTDTTIKWNKSEGLKRIHTCKSYSKYYCNTNRNNSKIRLYHYLLNMQ